MRGKHHVGFLRLNGLYHFFNRRGCKCGLGPCLNRTRFQYRGTGRDIAHFKNLGPAITKPAISNHQAIFIRRKLSGNSLHSIGTAARYNNNRFGVIDPLQRTGYTGHHALEGLGHVVQRTVGVYHGIFEQTVWVDICQ